MLGLSGQIFGGTKTKYVRKNANIYAIFSQNPMKLRVLKVNLVNSVNINCSN